MLMSMTVEITGVVPSVMDFDGYKEDCVRVSALIPFDVEKGGIGRGAEVFKYKTSDAIKEFQEMGLEKGSVLADCQVELVKVGSKSQLMLRSIKFKKV